MTIPGCTTENQKVTQLVTLFFIYIPLGSLHDLS